MAILFWEGLTVITVAKIILQIINNSVRIGDYFASVLEHGNLPLRIDLEEPRLILLSLQYINVMRFEREAFLMKSHHYLQNRVRLDGAIIFGY